MRKLIQLYIILSAIVVFSPTFSASVPYFVQLANNQTLIRDNGSEPSSLDPQKVEGTIGNNILMDLFEGLVIQDANGNIIPGQAKSWSMSKDKKVFTFQLRDSYWSNGDPVTAEDFVFAFRRLVDPKTGSHFAWYLEAASLLNAKEIIVGKKPPNALGIKALNTHQLQITLKEALPYFIQTLTHPSTFPVHKKTVLQYGNEWTRANHMVSNGAYQLVSWVVNDKIVLKRNWHYWDNKNTVINQVEFVPTQSDYAALNRYKAGEIDISRFPLKQYKSLKKTLPHEIKTTPELSVYYYIFNTQVKPFDDVRVRLALSYSIDREIITQKILGQGQKPAYGLTPEAVNGFTPPKLAYKAMTQQQRNQKAQQLLNQAGFNKQHPLKVTLLYNTAESNKKIAIAISQMWHKTLGVQMTLENKEWKTYLDSKSRGQFEIARAGWQGAYNEASTMLNINTSNHGKNAAKFNNAQFDQLMQQARQIADEKKRALIYEKAEQLLAQWMPNAPIFQYTVNRLVKPYVGGYPMHNIQSKVYTKNMYIIKHANDTH